MRSMGFTRRRIVRIALGRAGLAPLAAVAACGPSGAPDAVQEQAAANAQPATIRWTDDNSPQSTAYAADFDRRFHAKYPKITSAMEQFAGSSWKERSEKYTAMAVSGTMPELVWFSATFLRPFLIKGPLRPLDQFVKRDWKPAEIDDFFKGPYDGMKIDGKQMAIPATINTNIMYVNKNHLEEVGLAYPSDTWSREQFLEYVIRLNKRGGERWGFDMPFDNLDRNVSFILNNGGEPHDPNDGPLVTRLTYDQPKALEGLQFIHDMRWKHQVSPATNDQRGGLGTEDAFLAGKIAIYMVATNNAGNISAKAPGTGLDWDFLALPKGPGGQGARVSMDGYVLYRDTRFADQAWTVLRELISTEEATPRAQLRRLSSPRKSGAAPWEKGYEGKNAKLGRLMAETARADPRAFWKDSDQVGGIVEQYMSATFNRNEMGIPEAMRQAMAQVRGYYAGTT